MTETKHSITDEILKHTNIIDVIQEVTPLEKKGKNHVGLCPFHQENTPSFSVSEEKQLYHCFSCKASGNAITFIKETKNMESKDAIKYLADRANIPLSETFEKSHPLQKYFDINQIATTFYEVYLNHTKSGQKALGYLQNRNIEQKTIEIFNLGLAPNQRDALYQSMRKKEILKSDLLDLGLVSEKDNVYDVFRERLMFPLHDAKGNVIGFSGRILDQAKKTAKYINSTHTVTFEKTKVLYNLHRASKAIKAKNRAVLFEGFMDVIKAYEAGIQEGLASMGTAFSKHHIKLIQSLTDTLILCFDGDDAGVEATMSMVNDLKQTHLNVYVVNLPEKLDPDDYIDKYGAKKFQQLIDNALSKDEFLYEAYLKIVNLDKLTDIERFKKRVFSLINTKSNVEQGHFLNKMADDLKVPFETLALDFKAVRKDHVPTYKRIEKIEVTDKFRRAERGFIHYFLKDEYYARKFRHEFEDVSYIDASARDIQFEIFEFYDFNRQTCLVPKLFIETLPTKQKQYFEKYIQFETYPYHHDEFEDFLMVMHEYTKRNRIKTLRKQLNECETLEEKITLRKKIDTMIKEENDGKRKNNSRT